MGKISELTTKVNPVWADLVTWLDSEDANVQTKNKNFTVESIWNKNFSDKTTDDLAEWTNNLYYTDTRVDNNSTVVSLWVNKEDKSNKTDNITIDTWSNTKYPTVNAVENYVLNQWININWLTEESSIDSNDDLPFYDDSWAENKKITFSNLQSDVLDWIVKNGSITFKRSSADSSWIYTSSSVFFSKMSIWKLNISRTSSPWATVHRIEVSADDVNWSTLYEYSYGSWSLNIMYVFLIKEWLYYRTYLDFSWTVWDASTSFQYTI